MVASENHTSSLRRVLQILVLLATVVAGGLFVGSRVMYYHFEWNWQNLLHQVHSFGSDCRIGIGSIANNEDWHELRQKPLNLRQLPMPYRSAPDHQKPRVKRGDYLLTACPIALDQLDDKSGFAWLRLHAVYGESAIFVGDDLKATVFDNNDVEFPLTKDQLTATELTIISIQTIDDGPIGLATGMPLFFTDSRESLAALNLFSIFHYVIKPVFWLNFSLALTIVFAVAWLGGLRQPAIGWMVLALTADAAMTASLFSPSNALTLLQTQLSGVLSGLRNTFLGLAAFASLYQLGDRNFSRRQSRITIGFACLCLAALMATLALFLVKPIGISRFWTHQGVFWLANSVVFGTVSLVGIRHMRQTSFRRNLWTPAVTIIAMIIACSQLTNLLWVGNTGQSFSTAAMEIALTGFCILLIFDLVVWQRRFLKEKLIRQGNEKKHQLATAYADAMRSLAHDLRAPLTMLGQFVSRFNSAQDITQITSLRDTLSKELRVSLDRIQNLMSDFVSDRPDEFQFLNCPTRSLLELSLSDSLATNATSPKPLQVHTSFTDQDVIIADPHKLRRALTNILSNAIQASTKPQNLWLKTLPGSPGNLRIVIGNSGSYLSERAIDQVFEDGYTTKNKMGSGHGLSFVKQIVAAHGGNVSCTSQKGFGTEFILELPLATSRTSILQGLTKLRPRVALVEDNAFVQELWKEKLENRAELVCFDDPDSFRDHIQSCSKTSFSLVITDHFFEQAGQRIAGAKAVLDLTRNHLDAPVILSSDYQEVLDEQFDALIPKRALTWDELVDIFARSPQPLKSRL